METYYARKRRELMASAWVHKNLRDKWFRMEKELGRAMTLNELKEHVGYINAMGRYVGPSRKGEGTMNLQQKFTNLQDDLQALLDDAKEEGRQEGVDSVSWSSKEFHNLEANIASALGPDGVGVDDLVDIVLRVREERDKLREDKKRIDWLEKHDFAMNIYVKSPRRPKKLRALIDMAMKERGKEEAMRITLKFKTPDVVHDALERLPISQNEKEEIEELLKKWVRCGEFISVMFDARSGTATVLEAEK